MNDDFSAEPLPLYPIEALNGVIALMQGVAENHGVASAMSGDIVPLLRASDALRDLSDFLVTRAGCELVNSPAVRGPLDSKLQGLGDRAAKMPSSAAAYYQSYGYLAFSDSDVLSYASQRTISQLEGTLDHLALIPEDGVVPGESTAAIAPIPGMELIVTLPSQPTPLIPYWISLTVRIKVEEIFLLVLAMRLVEQELVAAGNGAGFAQDVTPYLTAFATALTDFDQGQYPSDQSSLGVSDIPGGSGSSEGGSNQSGSGTSSSAKDRTTVSFPISSGYSDAGTHAYGNSSDVGGGGGGLGSSSSSSSAVRRNIVLIGMWPPSNEAMVDFATQAPTPPNYVPAGLWTGWKGQDWLGSGFDVRAFFPTFKVRAPRFLDVDEPLGKGLFKVDYKLAADDFFSIIPPLKPVAIIAVTRGTCKGWKFEKFTRNLAHADWLDLWGINNVTPYSPSNPHVNYIGGPSWSGCPFNSGGPIQGNPPDVNVPAGTLKLTSLDYSNYRIEGEVRDKVGHVHIEFGLDAGSFVSEWIGYLCNWYGGEMSGSGVAFAESCPIHGSIHVASDLKPADAEACMVATLESIVEELHRRGFGTP